MGRDARRDAFTEREALRRFVCDRSRRVTFRLAFVRMAVLYVCGANWRDYWHAWRVASREPCIHCGRTYLAHERNRRGTCAAFW